MRVHGIDHINIRTHDLDKLCWFYTEILGLELGDRPSFDAPGAWLYAGGHPILHVGVTEDPPSGDTGPVDHYALTAEGLAETLERLDGAGIDYRLMDVPGRAMKQVFVHDPDGVAVELNFSAPEDVGG